MSNTSMVLAAEVSTSVSGLGNATTSSPDDGLHMLLLSKSYLEVQPEAAAIYIFMVAIALSVGTLGNLLIIGVFAFSRQTRTVGNEFIVNLAIADLCVTAITDPLCILGVTHGRSYFEERPELCVMIACLCLSACFCAFFNLSLVTLNRYVYICHNTIYRTIFTRPKIIAMCTSAWALAFLVESPNFLGWGGHGFDMKQLQCMWMRTGSYGYTMVVAVGLIGTPLILMTAAYVHIFLTIRHSKAKVFAQDVVAASKARKSELKETIKSAKSLFVVVLAFLVCWSPYTFTIVFDFEDRMPVSFHLWVTFLAHLHSALNCTIYALTNSNFRKGCLKFLHMVWKGNKDTSSLVRSTSQSNDKPNQPIKTVSGSTENTPVD